MTVYALVCLNLFTLMASADVVLEYQLLTFHSRRVHFRQQCCTGTIPSVACVKIHRQCEYLFTLSLHPIIKGSNPAIHPQRIRFTRANHSTGTAALFPDSLGPSGDKHRHTLPARFYSASWNTGVNIRLRIQDRGTGYVVVLWQDFRTSSLSQSKRLSRWVNFTTTSGKISVRARVRVYYGVGVPHSASTMQRWRDLLKSDTMEMERSPRRRRSLSNTLSNEEWVAVWIGVAYAAYIILVLVISGIVNGCGTRCKCEYMFYVTLIPPLLPLFLVVALFWWIPKYCCFYVTHDKPARRSSIEMRSGLSPTAPAYQNTHPEYPSMNAGYPSTAPAHGYPQSGYSSPAYPNPGYVQPVSNAGVSVTVIRA